MSSFNFCSEVNAMSNLDGVEFDPILRPSESSREMEFRMTKFVENLCVV